MRENDSDLSTNERLLLLIKHSLPEQDRERPPREWRLNDEGRRRSVLLSDRLRAFAPFHLYSSDEDKAVDTAAIVAANLGVESQTLPNLHEHERRRIGFLSDRQFISGVRELFAFPAQIVFGDETADQAYARFAGVVDRVCARHATGNVAIVGHGTVISLFVSRRAGMDGFDLWNSLDMPSIVALRLPGFRCAHLIRSVI
jgi:broad specificity phosphatase PhoE